MAEGLIGKIAPLGRRLLAREALVTRGTGIGLARTVAERRRPKHLDAATRLAQGRSLARRGVGAEPSAAPAEKAEMPSYISDFAAAVLFGDGSYEPSASGERVSPLFAESARLKESKLQRLAAGEELPRGVVQEVSGLPQGGAATPEQPPHPSGGFRLARKPLETPAPSAAEAERAPASGLEPEADSHTESPEATTSLEPPASPAEAMIARMPSPAADAPADLVRGSEPQAVPVEPVLGSEPRGERAEPVSGSEPQAGPAPVELVPKAPRERGTILPQGVLARQHDDEQREAPPTETPAPAAAESLHAAEPSAAAPPAAEPPAAAEEVPAPEAAPGASAEPQAAPAAAEPDGSPQAEAAEEAPAQTGAGTTQPAAAEPAASPPPEAEAAVPAPTPPETPMEEPETATVARAPAQIARVAIARIERQRPARPRLQRAPRPEAEVRPVQAPEPEAGSPRAPAQIARVAATAAPPPLSPAQVPAEPRPTRRNLLRRVADALRGAAVESPAPHEETPAPAAIEHPTLSVEEPEPAAPAPVAYEHRSTTTLARSIAPSPVPVAEPHADDETTSEAVADPVPASSPRPLLQRVAQLLRGADGARSTDARNTDAATPHTSAAAAPAAPPVARDRANEIRRSPARAGSTSADAQPPSVARPVAIARSSAPTPEPAAGPAREVSSLPAGGSGEEPVAARRVARMPTGRPLPVPIENVKAERAAVPAPVAAGSSGLTLAAAAGGTITRRTADELTIELPQPVERPFSPAPRRTISRDDTAEAAESPQTAEHAPAATSNGAQPQAHAAHGATGAHGGGPDLDEITEHVIEELKRQALFERERRGDLFGDLPT